MINEDCDIATFDCKKKARDDDDRDDVEDTVLLPDLKFIARDASSDGG